LTRKNLHDDLGTDIVIIIRVHLR